MKKQRKFSCYDICCGAGVFSLSFKKEGFKIIGGIDIDKHAIETAKRNAPKSTWTQAPLEKFPEVVFNEHGSPVYRANVIIAGLPCQGFSIAGNCRPGDKRNLLYKHLLEIASTVTPEFVVVENVRGLLAKRNNKVFADMLSGFRDQGYDVDYRIYDAANFGVPQHRKRVLIIASQTIPARFVFENIRFPKKYITVEDALRGLNPKIEDPSVSHTFMKHSRKVVNRIKNIKEGGPISYRRLVATEPAVTIIAGHNALPLHPDEHRAVSNREAARLQGIPDSFVLMGPRTAQTYQVANAVPFPLGLHVARAIKNCRKFWKASRGELYTILESKTDRRLKASLKQNFVSYYEKERRKYPWRRIRDPYTILITEILLQRTKSDTVRRVWHKVVKEVRMLEEDRGRGLKPLAKLIRKIGIFSRAETLNRLNTHLRRHFGKKVPETFEELMSLPGVGIYIASAVRTFAFNIPDFAVDSNAFRFVGRFFGIKIYGRKNEARQIREFMNTVIDSERPKEFVYGFLDFCAAVCQPRNPKCGDCSLSIRCEFYKK